VVSPIGWSTAQLFSTQINAPYTLDINQFILNSVPEFTLICSLFAPNFKAIIFFTMDVKRIAPGKKKAKLKI